MLIVYPTVFVSYFTHRSALGEDEFIPLSDEFVVSKYGPISRMVKAKLKQAHPAIVTAGQVIHDVKA